MPKGGLGFVNPLPEFSLTTHRRRLAVQTAPQSKSRRLPTFPAPTHGCSETFLLEVLALRTQGRSQGVG